MGESLNVRPDAVKQAKAKYLSTQEAEARARKDSDFFAWAEGREEHLSSGKHADDSRYPFPFVIIPTQLAKVEDKRKALILNSCLFILLSLETYPAHSRVLIEYICYCLKLPVDILSSSESTLVITLLISATSKNIDTDEARKQKAAQDAASRNWKVGLATVGGAVLVGVTGGLAAPLLLGVAGTIMGGVGLGGLATLLGATIANPVTIAALFGTLGGRMSGKAMDEFAKEVNDFKLIPVRKSKSNEGTNLSNDDAVLEQQKLRVVIGISGWLLDEDDIDHPWEVFSSESLEPFALQYERTALIKLGTSLDKVLRASAYTLAQAGAMQLALPAIAAAMLPVSLLKTGQFLDNPFSIAMERSDKAGKVLAAALMAKAQGERPVTLVGFSLGARVIYSCLKELADQKAFGLVESVTFAGSPVPSDELAWRRMRSVVVGRLVNVYTKSDLLLGFLYRTRNAQLNIAGLQAVSDVEGVENFDVSDFVKGHNQYRLAMGQILKEIRFHDLDAVGVENAEIELRTEDIKEKEIHNQAKRAGRLRGEEDDSGRIVMVDAVRTKESDLDPPFARSTESSGHEAVPTAGFGRMKLGSKDEAPLFHSQHSPHDSEDEHQDFSGSSSRGIHMRSGDDECDHEQDDDEYESSEDEGGEMKIVVPEPEPETESAESPEDAVAASMKSVKNPSA